ncbi:MAG: endonuclease/exonuclease/phosphatase family protein [Bacteroidaceae bacterium]|nr:endonuclease/exonuclease/phosphatase family protein [Bacteroidaceae bacterium]
MASYKIIKTIEDETMRKRTAERLLALRQQLNNEVPAKTVHDTLLLATWNIRDFGDGRTMESLCYIAEIIDHFDLVVVQEISANHLNGFKTVMSILGNDWSYIMSDGVAGGTGGNEAMAFVFNTNKVKPTGIVGEIVLPPENLIEGLQFARTPYLASFRAGWFDFKLCTVHIYYGDESKEKNEEGVVARRINEINAIASNLLARQKKEDISYILLGDFNIPDTKGKYFNALVNDPKKGFFIPNEIQKHPTDLGQVSHYDQIAFKLKLEQSMVLYKDGEQRAGAFNFTKSVYRHSEECSDWEIYRDLYDPKHEKTEKQAITSYKKKRTWQMSDHLPLWAELKVDFSDEYLKNHIK